MARRERTHGHLLFWLVLLAGAGTSFLAHGALVTGDRLGRLTLVEVRALAASVGFPDPDLAAAVAYAESGGFPHVIGDGGTSFGLWQVNVPSHPQYKGDDLKDPTYSAHAALAISRNGTDFTPWTQYRNGAYKQFMPMGGAA